MRKKKKKRKVILDYLGALNVNTRIIKSRRGGRRGRTKDGSVAKTQPNPADYEITRGLLFKECGWSLEVGKGKETDLP